MRKSVYQTKYEESLEVITQQSLTIHQLDEAIVQLKKEHNAQTMFREKDLSKLAELNTKYQAEVNSNYDLNRKIDALEAKVQTLIASIHLLARAADGNPDNPLEPTF